MSDLQEDYIQASQKELEGPSPSMKRALRPGFGRLIKFAAEDLLEGIYFWRIWLHLGLNDIRVRYRRSFVGQNWQTLSMAVFIGATTLIYSVLLGVEAKRYAPYVTCAFAIWTLISAIITEGTSSYISSETLLRHYSVPKSVCLYQLIVRNMAIFAHNIVLVAPVFVITGQPFYLTMIFIIPALVLYALNGIWISAVLGAISARFRDVPQIVNSIMQIMFILTPVLYTTENAGKRQQIVSELNPFAHFLAIGRDPLLGRMPNETDMLIVCSITVIGSLIGFIIFAYTRRRILYWL